MAKKITVPIVLLLAGFAMGRITAGAASVLAEPAAQPPPGHVYELRTYTAAEGRMPALHARFRDHTLQIFERHNLKSVGYWTPLEGPTAGTTLVYILEHPNREEARRNWAAFGADPEWQKVKAASEAAAGGSLTAKIDSVFLTPTDYSPMK